MNKIILCGGSGSGKSHILNEFRKKKKKISLKVTTRPKRTGEIDDVDYHFITNEEFNTLLDEGKFITHQSFINDKGITFNYGTLKEDFDNLEIFIMSPGELSQLDRVDRLNCYVMYLDVDRELREKRLLERGDSNDSIERRMRADYEDFKDFEDYDLLITENNDDYLDKI